MGSLQVATPLWTVCRSSDGLGPHELSLKLLLTAHKSSSSLATYFISHWMLKNRLEVVLFHTIDDSRKRDSYSYKNISIPISVSFIETVSQLILYLSMTTLG